jgi:hypothetical protein
MESEGLLPFSEERAIESCPEAREFSSHIHAVVI